MPRTRQSKTAEQAPPTAGHNSALDDAALIAENFKIEDLIKQSQAKFDEWAKPHKARIAEIEAEIHKRLLERKADSTKTDAGTAYFSEIMNTKVESPEQLFDFVAEHWGAYGADVKLNLPIGKVLEHMDENNGALPPGMSNSFFKRLNIKRS